MGIHLGELFGGDLGQRAGGLVPVLENLVRERALPRRRRLGVEAVELLQP